MIVALLPPGPRPGIHHLLRCIRATLLLAGAAGPGLAASAPPDTPTADRLPPAIAASLARAGIPARSFALWVQPVDQAAPLASWNAAQPMNPASLLKLVTTTAALDQLGPAYAWQTPVWLSGVVEHATLRGNLVVRGSGDPSLVIERVWLLLRHVRELGVQTIDGDIVLDHGAFAATARTPAEFDGEPSEPYNVQPDALLLNFKAVTLQFTPDPARGVAHVIAQPALDGVAADATVRLSEGPCDDWRGRLKLGVSDPTRWHATGTYPAACGERAWPLAYADPAHYDERLVAALWRELGGRLTGSVHAGSGPVDTRPTFEFASPPLASVVRDVNKFSNNVMAEQIWLTLGAARRAGTPAGIAAPTEASAAIPATEPASVSTPAAATASDAHAAILQWLRERVGVDDEVIVVNGSGLARETRLSARALARVLQWTWRSPVMPELLASLPVVGVDGTLRRANAVPARAHLKTGSMRDVLGVAGVVLGADDHRYVLVALVNDPRALGARAVIDAAIQWTQDQGAAAPALVPAAVQNR